MRPVSLAGTRRIRDICKCGQTDHKNTSHRNCPLNKRRQEALTDPENVSRPQKKGRQVPLSAPSSSSDSSSCRAVWSAVWRHKDPKAFTITPQTARDVYVDLTLLNQSMTSSCSPSPPPREPMHALKALTLWLRDRMTLQHAIQLVVHLSTYTLKRQKKAQQIYIDAEPDAGKTTLFNLLEKTFSTRCFSVSAESKAFMAAAFDEKRKDAIWMEDEFNAHLFWAFDQKHFNKIVEGDLSSFVA